MYTLIDWQPIATCPNDTLVMVAVYGKPNLVLMASLKEGLTFGKEVKYWAKPPVIP